MLSGCDANPKRRKENKRKEKKDNREEEREKVTYPLRGEGDIEICAVV